MQAGGGGGCESVVGGLIEPVADSTAVNAPAATRRGDVVKYRTKFILPGAHAGSVKFFDCEAGSPAEAAAMADSHWRQNWVGELPPRASIHVHEYLPDGQIDDQVAFNLMWTDSDYLPQ